MAKKELVKLFRTFLIVVFLLTGCGRFERQATVASTEDFRKLLIEQIRHSGNVEELSAGGGEAGNIYTRDFYYLLPADKFPPKQLITVAQAAAKQWGELEKYSTTGKGGSENRFEMDYGSHSTHAFIDVFAYTEGDKTHIEVLIRVVQ